MHTKKVMVIDDEPAIHRLLQIILEGEGYLIVGPEEPGEAGSTLSGSKPDLIILDIMMPEMNGFDVLRMLKSDPETRGIPVLILTVRNMMEDMEKARVLGADAYMTKPFQPAELVKAIRSLSSNHSSCQR